MTTIVRFAPSPTGLIHIGNARTAIHNWLFAKNRDGQFVLRYDDTDTARSKQEYTDAIARDLEWLNIKPDVVAWQSKRFAFYDEAADKLKADGRLYPCYETPDELDRKRKRQLARGKPPVYDRAALKLTADEKAAFEAEGRTAHWRFLLADDAVEWNDLIRGFQHVEPGNLSDPILIRGDGSYLYTLPSVVDDMDMNISHIIRGEDHVTNSAVQIQIFDALGGTAPAFAHHSLLIGADGQGLSKRLGSLSISHLHEDGLEPMAVVSHAALIGTSDAVTPHHDMQELVKNFAIEKLSRAPARFDEAELTALNAKLLHGTEYKNVAERLKELGCDDEELWNVIRGNLEQLSDAKIWHNVVHGDIAPVIDDGDRDFITSAKDTLPLEPWDDETWKSWVAAVKEASGRKGKQLFMPLRLALTGLDHGPELAPLLPLIGRDKVMNRLS